MHQSTSPAYKETPSDARELFCLLWLKGRPPEGGLAKVRIARRLMTRADTLAPEKDKCRIYTLAPRPKLRALRVRGDRSRAEKWQERAARASHRFPVDSFVFGILSEAALSGATPCR